MASVLVFGASSTVAMAVARRCAARGDRLALVGRNPERITALAAELGEAVALTRSGVDLTDRSLHDALIADAEQALGGLDVALVAHGWLPDQLRTESDVEEAIRAFEVNLLSAVSLVARLANRLEARGAGHLAVITSVAGMRGRPRNYTYGAAKGGLSLYLQGVRSRLYRSGVQVHDLRPGPILTPMTEGHPVNPLFASPERVAAGILAAIDGGWPVRYLPWYWWPIMQVVVRLPEPIFQRLGFLSGR